MITYSFKNHNGVVLTLRYDDISDNLCIISMEGTRGMGCTMYFDTIDLHKIQRALSAIQTNMLENVGKV